MKLPASGTSFAPASTDAGPREDEAQLEGMHWHEREKTRKTALEQHRDEERYIRNLRRIARTASFLFFVVLGAAIWQGVTAFNFQASFERPYDPLSPFQLEVVACDVVFTVGAAPTVKIEALAKLAAYAWTPAGAATATGASFANTLSTGCSTMPLGACSRLCKVTVTVPPEGAASFAVDQPNTDTSGAPRLAIEDGVSLGSLTVGAW